MPTKYQSTSTRREKPRLNEPHFIWRGIGCISLLIIPAISIAAGVLITDYGLAHNWAIPYELLGYPRLPDVVYKSTGLMTLLSPIISIQNFYAYAVISFITMVVLGGIISLLYAIVYRFVAPPRYGPLDVERPNIRVKRYKR